MTYNVLMGDIKPYSLTHSLYYYFKLSWKWVYLQCFDTAGWATGRASGV